MQREAYLLNNICAKNYWNQTVKIIVGGRVVYFLGHSVVLSRRFKRYIAIK